MGGGCKDCLGKGKGGVYVLYGVRRLKEWFLFKWIILKKLLV